jgi:glucose/arabinose dehydrogenase
MILLLLTGACSREQKSSSGEGASTPSHGSCPAGSSGLTLPAGFCATVFADHLGHARDIVVASNGDVFVNTWGGNNYRTAPPPAGFLVALRDTKHSGSADTIVRFGPTPDRSATGGTGIALYDGYLYAEAGSDIVRYRLPAGELRPDTTSETVVSGLPITGDHAMHPFVIDGRGALYVDVGSATNSCQVDNRQVASPGQNPCTELETRGGIWKFDANTTGQSFSPAQRFVTGLRNGVGIAIDPADGTVYATQHGRDQLGDNFPALYTMQQSAELPAEELVHLAAGADYGWPTCYFDGAQKKLVLAPEYGGDGGKAVGECANKAPPVAFFPAHWAPDGLVFYSGSMFPARYRGGIFIAFHGSWNRMVGPQEGYNLVFLPFAQGQSAATYEIFADGFAGPAVDPVKADHRPVGLAVAPDGALFVADDQGGRIWRIAYGAGPS